MNNFIDKSIACGFGLLALAVFWPLLAVFAVFWLAGALLYTAVFAAEAVWGWLARLV